MRSDRIKFSTCGGAAFGAALVLAAHLAAADAASPGEHHDILPPAEAAALAEVYRLVDEVGDEIWPGLAGVPFPVVLVTATSEALVGWEKTPPPHFSDPVEHPTLGRVMARARTFSPGLTAAFPAFGPPAVVVIGTMEATGRTPGEWALTLLHEHFHQLQYAAPDYYRDVEALDLSGGDTSGMWMLEYPFPYEDEAIGELFGELVTAIRRALDHPAESAAAWSALERLIAALEPADARYLEFQLWQEGVGRFVELAASERLAELGPESELAALGGFSGWRSEAEAARRRILDGLEKTSLAVDGRVAFYPVGAALAILLDREGQDWKSRYLERRFTLRPDRAGVEITYLANEGFLLAAGDDKVLIDALFPGIDGYQRVPDDVLARLERAAPPFDGIDLVLATHFHRDHFGAREVARFLTASPARFVSTPDAVELLEKEAGQKIDAVASYPSEGEYSRLEVGDVTVTQLNLHHGRSQPEIQNLAFLIEIGGLKILHVGDTEVRAGELAYDLAAEKIDVAMLPGWLAAEPSWRPLVEKIGARHLVVMHLAGADAPASWFGSAGSREGRVALIHGQYPRAWIPGEPLESRRYERVP